MFRIVDEDGEIVSEKYARHEQAIWHLRNDKKDGGFSPKYKTREFFVEFIEEDYDEIGEERVFSVYQAEQHFLGGPVGKSYWEIVTDKLLTYPEAVGFRRRMEDYSLLYFIKDRRIFDRNYDIGGITAEDKLQLKWD